jgi:guanylate kinase
VNLSPKLKKGSPNQSRLLVVSAPSGAGKTTLCDMILKEFPNVALSVSATTREKRPNEKEGVHYFFLSPEAFKDKVEKGEFAEWAKVHNHLYGTPKLAIEKWLSHGKHVLFDIDVQGAMSLLQLYGDRVCLIFILPPPMEELKRRLLDRKGDSLTSIENRLINAYNELEWSKKFDYRVMNDDLESAYRELKEIVKKECP